MAPQAENTARPDNVLLASVYMLISCLAFVGIWTCTRYLIVDMHPFLVAFYRTAFGLLFLLPTALRGRHLRIQHRANLPLFALRALMSCITVFSMFYAVGALPLTDAVAYSYAAPIFATLGAALFLKEKLHLPRIATVITGFIGMLILMRPGINTINAGVMAALLASVSIAGVILTMKRLSARDENPQTIAAQGFVMMLPIVIPIAIYHWYWPNWQQLLLLCGVGAFSAISQTFLGKSLSQADASAVIPIDFTRLIFAALVGFVLFAEQPDIYSFIGAGVILASSIYAAHREALHARREKAAILPHDGS